MAVLPVRDLGAVGVVTDVEPYNLPIQGFSRADNVVFEDGMVARAPIFKSVYKEPDNEYQTAAFATQAAASGTDEFFVCDRSYNVFKWAYPAFTSTSTGVTYLLPDATPSADTVPVTSTTLSEVVYFNKPDRRPIYKLPSETFFRELHPKDAGTSASGVTSSWGSLTDVWKCQSLRSYGDFLLALNTSEGSSNYPARVRWCDPVLNGSAGLAWDASDTTTLAGFNDLVQIEGGIVDGMSLGNQFVIYSKDQVWLMEFVGGQFVFNFRRLFTGAGLINANSICEVDNNHYVFGTDDIYIHNGTQKQSIAKGKVRDFIYKGLNTDKKHAIFVHHDVRFKKIMFCYNSEDANVKYTNASHCNKAAVYSYIEGTWSFMDLPNLTCSGVGNLNSLVTYDAAGAPTYDSLGGTYLDSAGSYARQSIFGNRILRSASLNGVDTAVKNITHARRPNSGSYNFQQAELTFEAGHNISVGDTLTISGLPSPYTIWNGTQTVTAISSTNIIKVGTSAVHSMVADVAVTNVTAVNSGNSTRYPPFEADSFHGLTHTHLLSLDSITRPAVVADYDSTLNTVAVLERTGIDLDETGQHLKNYKNLTALYPQMTTEYSSNLNTTSEKQLTAAQAFTPAAYTVSQTIINAQALLNGSVMVIEVTTDTNHGLSNFQTCNIISLGNGSVSGIDPNEVHAVVFNVVNPTKFQYIKLNANASDVFSTSTGSTVSQTVNPTFQNEILFTTANSHNFTEGSTISISGVGLGSQSGLDVNLEGSVLVAGLASNQFKLLLNNRHELSFGSLNVQPNSQDVFTVDANSSVSLSRESAYELIKVSIGAADFHKNTPNYTTEISIESDDYLKIDTRAAGRYLSYKLAGGDPQSYFSLTGFDAEYKVTGRR